MLSVLSNSTYSRLFLAQVIALVGTGLMTVALGLLAFDIAGPQAGAVLGTALAIKMIAYVALAPVANAEDRPSLFAAQFALSHACWLLTYPLAGWAGDAVGMAMAMGLLGFVAAIGVLLAVRVWPGADGAEIAHTHPDLAPDHPHLKAHGASGHRHVFVIDDEHRVWPSHG